MSKRSDEARLTERSDLEDSIRSYYNTCLKTNYDFNTDICDIVCDATDRAVNLNPA